MWSRNSADVHHRICNSQTLDFILPQMNSICPLTPSLFNHFNVIFTSIFRSQCDPMPYIFGSARCSAHLVHDVFLIYMIHLLTAIGLPPGGSSTVHIYTQTIHRTTQNKQYIEQHKNFGRVRAVPRLCELYPGICLATGEKARINLFSTSWIVQVAIKFEK